MNTFCKYLAYFLILDILVVIAGFFLLKIVDAGFRFSDLAALTLIFSLINLIILYVFFRGQRKDPSSQTIHIMISAGLKFLLEIVLALLWFFVCKKTSLYSLLLFFILYLAFTLLSTFAMLKTLKSRSL